MFDGFFDNVFRFFRYFIAIILGVFLNWLAPLAPLFKRPTTAIALVSLLIGFVTFVALTLRAMLGLSPI